MQEVINEWHDGLAGFAELEEVAAPDTLMEALCAEAAGGGVADFGLLFDVEEDIVVPQPSKRRRVGSGSARVGGGGGGGGGLDSSAANTSPSGGMGAAGAGEAGGSDGGGCGAVADTGGDATMMAFETLLEQGSAFDFDIVMPECGDAGCDSGGGGGGGARTRRRFGGGVPHSTRVPYAATAGGPARDAFAGLSWDCDSGAGSCGGGGGGDDDAMASCDAGAGGAAAGTGAEPDLGLVRSDFDKHAERLLSSAVVDDAVAALLGGVSSIAGSHKPLRSVHPWPMKVLLWHYMSLPAAARPGNVLDAAKRTYAGAWETAVGVKFDEPVGERWAQEMQRVITAGGGFFTSQWRGSKGPDYFAVGFQEVGGDVTTIRWIIPFALLTTLMKSVWSHRFSSRRILESVLRSGTNWVEVPFYTRDIVALAAAQASGRGGAPYASSELRAASDIDL
jgi:hypothetical protein